MVEKYKPFKIVCHGVSIPAGEYDYRFLNIIENKKLSMNAIYYSKFCNKLVIDCGFDWYNCVIKLTDCEDINFIFY